MSYRESSNRSVAARGIRREWPLAVIIVLLMLFSTLPIIAPSTSSDPDIKDNWDMTRSVFWNLTSAADYALYNSSVSDGLGRLANVNETTGENSTAQYLLGTSTNVELQTVPDSMLIDNASLPVQSITLQPGPEGIDNYLDEWFPLWSPPDGSDLTLNSQYDPDPAFSKRSSIVMQFDLSAVPGDMIVKNAILSLYEKPSKAQVLEYTIHALSSNWTENGVTWRTRTSTTSWNSMGGDFSTEPFSWGMIDGTTGWRTFDLTRLVDHWLRNATPSSTPNLGFIIVPKPGIGDAAKNFVDCEITNKPEQRPKLTINYTLGEAVGAYESIPLGPGTNSTFTIAGWSNGTFSKASDEFTASSLSQKWSWTMDPALSGGSVNFDRAGWLNVTGSQSTYLPNATIGCNFLHQDITGNFTAETGFQTYFSSSSMGAGLMMMSDAITWISIYATGVQGSQNIVAKVSKGGTNISLGSIPWTSATAFLRIVRDGASYQLLASTDCISWITVGVYAPLYDFGLSVSMGPLVFSGGSPSQPIVEFDYVKILPAGQTTVLEITARTGNSTSLADPSWLSWSAPLGPNSGASIDSAGKYIQYRVVMRTTFDWLSPSFSDFECHYERFASNGTITTGEVAPTSFLTWESMTVTQTLAAGDIEYFYSTDHGGSWTSLGSGNSFAFSIPIQTLMIRAELSTQDTAVTPSVNTIEVVYRITHAWFYVSAPATAQAGQLFSVYVEPKDTSNDTATWTGAVTLNAVDSSGAGGASSELAVTQAVVPAGGHLTVATESYDVAETIRVVVSGGGASGISQNVVVVPGPANSIIMEPNVTVLTQSSSTVFTVIVCDAFGNNITDASLTWHADAGLGSLNTTTGSTVNLTTVETESSGYLTVSTPGVTASMFIFVSPLNMPPQIDPNIPVQTKPEDFGSWTLDLSPYVSDREDNLTRLRWYTLNESVVKVTGENLTGDLFIKFATVQDMFGINLLDLYVVDSDRMSSRATITVNITPVNDPPKIVPIDPIIVRYDDPYQYNVEFYVSDVETPPKALTLWVDSASAPYVHVSNLWLTFLYPEVLNGTQQTVFLSVSDGEYTASTVIWVSISDDHVPRTLGPLPDQVMYQGDVKRDAFNLDDYFSDPDGPNVYFTNDNTHVGVIIQLNHTVDFYAPGNWDGQEFIMFTAKDDEGARAESALRMRVIAVNQPPTISNVPDLVVRQGLRYDFDLSPYISDPDDDIGTLTVTVGDPRAWTFGPLLSMLFPSAMVGSKVPVNITVSDGLLSDWWLINVTVSEDYPPELLMVAPDHSFLEDNPIDYPVVEHLEDFFTDRDGDPLTYIAFVSVQNITAEVALADGNWTIQFESEQNWYGSAFLTFRATDGQGALVETTVSLTVLSVPDPPVLSLPDSITVTQGFRSLLDLSKNVTDPDSALTDFRWVLDSDYPDFMSIHGGIIILDFPLGFLNEGEESRTITVTVSVSDQDNLLSTDSMTITVTRNVVVASQNPLLWLGLLCSVGAVAILSVYAITRRRRPFVVNDMMLIHNDGFLITRLAHHAEGEIDQDVMSGMLTAVLNFVEDSMGTSADSLKTFGFKEYQVLVSRGQKVFAAVVFQGDLPDDIDKPMKEFTDTVERVYRKKLANWTGDIETDFAGVEVLIQGFVKEHSKGHKAGSDVGIWRKMAARGKVKPRKVTVNTITQEKVERRDTLADEEGGK
jgi:regulation of enolase protein 1 (concanavalin A-like superfamily)